MIDFELTVRPVSLSSGAIWHYSCQLQWNPFEIMADFNAPADVVWALAERLCSGEG